jgi:hypothetical protein
MSREDRQGARTASDLERKYNLGNLGKQFAEVYGITTDARRATLELEAKLQSEILSVKNQIKESTDGILLKSEFETYQGTVNAELALKVGKDDNRQIISMLEAYADEIRLQSNTLVIDSDFFKLTRNGVATIDSAQIDYAKMTHARIGCAQFTDNGNYGTVSQIYFMNDGIYLGQNDGSLHSRSCLVWDNTDGTDIFRIRGNTDGLHIEGLEYSESRLDLKVFGISIRELYNKVNALSGGDSGGDDTGGGSTTCFHDHTTEGGNMIDSCHTEMWTECIDCGEILSTWTETHHGNVGGDGYCNDCGEYAG